MPTADKIHVLHAERPVNADAVAQLEKALADARAGEIVSVALAGVTFDGGARTAYSIAENGVTQLGAVEILRARVAAGLKPE